MYECLYCMPDLCTSVHILFFVCIHVGVYVCLSDRVVTWALGFSGLLNPLRSPLHQNTVTHLRPLFNFTGITYGIYLLFCSISLSGIS